MSLVGEVSLGRSRTQREEGSSELLGQAPQPHPAPQLPTPRAEAPRTGGLS